MQSTIDNLDFISRFIKYIVDEIEQVKCHNCGSTYLHKHANTYKGKKRYMCQNCNVTFTTYADIDLKLRKEVHL